MVAQAFEPSTSKAEAGLNSKPAWSTQQIPGQSGLHREYVHTHTWTQIIIKDNYRYNNWVYQTN